MALAKPLPTEFGPDATYFHICAIAWEIGQPVAVVQVAGYYGEAHRRQPGTRASWRANYQMPVTDGQVPTREAAYAWLRTVDIWVDAVDA